MKLGLMLHDPEEEHDCFSDNTHNSHYYDALGIRNVYLGRYVRIDGRVVAGPERLATWSGEVARGRRRGARQARRHHGRDGRDLTRAARTAKPTTR